MARSTIKTADIRKNSGAFTELYNKDGMTVYATKSGKFEIHCGTTHTVAGNLEDVQEKINSLDLHTFPGSGTDVVASIRAALGNQFRLEVRSSKNEKESTLHTVEGSLESIADKMTGMTAVDVKTMTAGKRYAMGQNAFGGDYMILVPMGMGMDMGFGCCDGEAQMYEKQPYTKGMVLHGIDPKCQEVVTICIDSVYPNGSFKDTDGKVWGDDEAERMQFAAGEATAPVEEDFHEVDEALYTSEDIPSYNPVGVVKETVPMLGQLKNYDTMLSASAGVLSDFMKTCKKAAFIDRSSLNKITVTAVNEDGCATDGELSWNVRVTSPSYKRSSLISVPMVMKAGTVDLKGTFHTSTNKELPLTVEGLKAHMGSLAEDDMFRLGSKDTGFVSPSTIRADKTVDSLLKGIVAEKKVAGPTDLTPATRELVKNVNVEGYAFSKDVQALLDNLFRMEDWGADQTDEDQAARFSIEEAAEYAIGQNAPVEQAVKIFEQELKEKGITSKSITSIGSKKTAMTIKDLENDASLILVDRDMDVQDIKEHVGEDANDFDGFFVEQKDGDYVRIYGYEGSIPYSGKNVFQIVGSKKTASDFGAYCKTLTDNQVLNVIEKEREGMQNDPDREADYQAAKEEAVRRGIASKKTASTYEVNVGNIGNIACADEAEANETFNEYVEQSKSGRGRAAGESVILMKDGEPVKEHEGTQNALEASKKTAGGESYSDVMMQQEAIESSETEEEAIQKLKDMGYESTFDPDGDGRVETIEELVGRVWSLYKDPAMKEDLGLEASKKTAGGESYSDVIMQQEAIESSETEEEAVQKLKDMGYESTFSEDMGGRVETVEECVNRVWSLYKDPAMKEDLGLEASKKTAAESDSSLDILNAKTIEDMKKLVEAMGYDVDENDHVKSPGQFEAEHISTIYFHELYMNGDQGEEQLDFGEGEGINYYKLSPEEKKLFEADANEDYFALSFSSQGFIGGAFISKEDMDAALKEYEETQDSEDTGESYASKKTAAVPAPSALTTPKFECAPESSQSKDSPIKSTKAGKKTADNDQDAQIIQALADAIEKAGIEALGTDASLTTSLGEYAVFFPKKGVVAISMEQHGGYVTSYSAQECLSDLEDIEDGYFKFIGSTRQEEIDNLDNYTVPYHAMSMHGYDGRVGGDPISGVDEYAETIASRLGIDLNPTPKGPNKRSSKETIAGAPSFPAGTKVKPSQKLMDLVQKNPESRYKYLMKDFEANGGTLEVMETGTKGKGWIQVGVPGKESMTGVDRAEYLEKVATKKIAADANHVAPDFWIVGIDETQYWADDIKAKVDGIVTFYLYDANEITHLASFSGSYYLYPIVTEPYVKEGLSEEEREQVEQDIMDNADNKPDYYDESYIDSMPAGHKKQYGDMGLTAESRADGDDNNKSSYDDGIESIIDHLVGNPPYMPELMKSIEGKVSEPVVKEGSDLAPPASKATPAGADADMQNNVSAAKKTASDDGIVVGIIAFSGFDEPSQVEELVKQFGIPRNFEGEADLEAGSTIEGAVEVKSNADVMALAKALDATGKDIVMDSIGGNTWGTFAENHGSDSNVQFVKEALDVKDASKKTAGVTIIYEINKMTQKDSITEGASGDVTDFGTIDKGTAKSADDLFMQLETLTSIPKEDWFVFEDGRITGNINEDNDGLPVDGGQDDEETKRLSEEGKLYLSDYDVYIELGDGSEASVNKLVNLLGINSYDGEKPGKDFEEEGAMASKKQAMGEQNLVTEVKQALSELRSSDHAAYEILVEEYRDSMPHTGQQDILSGEKFDKWLESNAKSDFSQVVKDLLDDIKVAGGVA